MARTEHNARWQQALVLLLLVTGLWLFLGPGRPVGLGNLQLDRGLEVQPDSVPPSGADVRPGDRVVQIGATPVNDARQLVIALSNAPREVEVSIAQHQRRETLELRPASFETGLPLPLQLPHRMRTIDGEACPPDLSIDDLRRMVGERAPAPLLAEVEYEDLARGPLVQTRHPAELFGLAWWVLALLVGVWSAWPRAPSYRTRWRAHPAFLVAGALAAGMLSVCITSPFCPQLLEYTGLWLAATWRCWAWMAGGHGPGAGRFSLRSLGAWLPCGLLGVLYLWLLMGPDQGIHMLQLEGRATLLGAGLVLVYQVTDLAVGWSRGMPRARLGLVDAVQAGSAVLAGALVSAYAWAPGDIKSASAALAAAAIVVPAWSLHVLAWRSNPTWGDAGQGQGGLAWQRLLITAHQWPGVVHAAWAVGHGDAWQLMEDDRTAPSGISQAPETLGAALTMLHQEGDMYPPNLRSTEAGAVDDEHPMAGVLDRLGWQAALSLSVGDAPGEVQHWLLLRGADGEPIEPAVLEHALRWLRDAPLREAAAEVVLLAADMWLRHRPMPVAASRVEFTEERELAAPVTQADAPPPGEPADPVSETWARRLASMWAESHPVDDPLAVGSREVESLLPWCTGSEPMLIHGEPAVGKTFVARWLHGHGPRAPGRYAEVDAALVPPAVALLELFGDEEEPGILSLTRGGTLVLRSLGCLPTESIARIVEESSRQDVRLIFVERVPADTTLGQVAPGLASMPSERLLYIPPLRERQNALARLVELYTHRWSMAYHRRVTEVSGDVLRWAAEQPWTGNLRELISAVSAAVLRCPGDTLHVRDIVGIEAEDLGSADALDDEAAPLDEAERLTLLQALEEAGGNRSEAARQLGITRGKLLRRMRRYGIA
jgi:hypothetical protein